MTEQANGRVYVNGQIVNDPWGTEFGEQMPMVVLRLAANATSTPDADADVCLRVELPGVVVTGVISLCGDVVLNRLEPLETQQPGEPSYPPRYDEPTISGVPIRDRMLDINSYPMLDIADVLDVQACFDVQVRSNDVWVTTSIAICASAQRTPAGEVVVSADGMEWTFDPTGLHDAAVALRTDVAVDASLEIINRLDDVRHSLDLQIWVTPPCAGG